MKKLIMLVLILIPGFSQAGEGFRCTHIRYQGEPLREMIYYSDLSPYHSNLLSVGIQAFTVDTVNGEPANFNTQNWRQKNILVGKAPVNGMGVGRPVGEMDFVLTLIPNEQSDSGYYELFAELKVGNDRYPFLYSCKVY